MKKQNAYPRYLDALLTKTFYPDTSSEHKRAVRYIQKVDNRIEKGHSKTSTLKK